MTDFKIFYSWQSDLPNSTNRGFIEKALQSAAKNIRDDDSITVEPVVDRDTLGIPGSPDIAQTILEKIDQSQLFVCDISIINQHQESRPTPNPNVLLELGYAIKSLGARRVIMVMNTAYGLPDLLPFDLRLKRVIPYSLPEDVKERTEERKKLVSLLESGIRAILTEVGEKSKALVPDAGIELDKEWLTLHRSVAKQALKESQLPGFMELCFSLSTKAANFSHNELMKAAEHAQIHTFGWPIGILMNTPDFMPKPRVDGIVSNILIEHPLGNTSTSGEKESYDYWALRKNGDFYLLKSIFEDMSEKEERMLFFDTRIVRVTEVLLYCKRLYSNLNIDPSTRVKIGIKHGGLKGRRLSATRSRRFFMRVQSKCEEDEVETFQEVSLSSIDENLVEIVKEFCYPLFILFGFHEFEDETYSGFVNNYANGRMR